MRWTMNRWSRVSPGTRPELQKTRNEPLGATSGSTSSLVPSLKGKGSAGRYVPLTDREAYRRLLPLGSMPVRYTVPSAATLGFHMDRPGMLTSSGKRCGSLQPEAVRSTRQRLETRPGTGWPGLGRVASVSGIFGRVDWKTMYEPSGDIAGDESGHSPEKAASSGRPHCPLRRCDSRMTVQCAALRVKKSVLPSGEKVGEPSLAGPEITPGANTSGAGVVTAGVDSPYATVEISKHDSTQQRLLPDMTAPRSETKFTLAWTGFAGERGPVFGGSFVISDWRPAIGSRCRPRDSPLPSLGCRGRPRVSHGGALPR